MTWERYRCITDCKTYPKECISENLIVEMADIMVNEGFVFYIKTLWINIKFKD
jgi:alpha-galactosidase